MIGSPVSHYRILEKLGEGGMGVVYKAEDTKLQRTVALKFVHPNLMRDEKAKQCFMQEARAVSRLDHPNICTIHEFDETESGQMFLAMGYYKGETLRDKIDRSGTDGRPPRSIDDALDIAIQITSGLFAAHVEGVIHRDIKPANIFITKRKQVKILDFGLAKLADADLSREGLSMGTIAYVSPEQAEGEQTDARTDIWSTGVLFYEVLTGRLPFTGEADEVILYNIVHEDPELISDGVPANIEPIIKKAMAKEHKDRYRCIEEMCMDLRAVRKSEGFCGSRKKSQIVSVPTFFRSPIDTTLVL